MNPKYVVKAPSKREIGNWEVDTHDCAEIRMVLRSGYYQAIQDGIVKWIIASHLGIGLEWYCEVDTNIPFGMVCEVVTSKPSECRNWNGLVKWILGTPLEWFCDVTSKPFGLVRANHSNVTKNILPVMLLNHVT